MTTSRLADRCQLPPFRGLGGGCVIGINDRASCRGGAHFSLTATLRIHRDRHK